MVAINFDELKNLVAEFREVRLVEDQQKMGKFEVAGQAVLYSQIAEAYRIGLILLERTNAMMFINLMKSHNMVDQATKYGNNNYTNGWLFVTKLLYGSWEEKAISNTVFHVWQHDRSSEKYANVLRHLAELGKQPEEVAAFIPNFEYENKDGVTVRKLQGLEIADREANARDGSRPDTSTQLTLGTSRAEPDVMGIPLPAELDPEIEYGSCFFKVENKQMIIFGATKLEEGEFKKLAIARGKVIKKRDDDLAKAADAVSATTEADRKAVTKLVVQDPKLAALKKKLLADPDYAVYIIDAEKEAKNNSVRVKDEQQKKQKVAFMELALPDSSAAGPVAKSTPKVALVKRKSIEAKA